MSRNPQHIEGCSIGFYKQRGFLGLKNELCRRKPNDIVDDNVFDNS